MANARSKDSESLRAALPVLVSLIVASAIVVGLAILPMRTWLSQRSAGSEGEARLGQLNQEVVELEARLRLLSSDAEIERLARKNFDMAYPGEESYRILPRD